MLASLLGFARYIGGREHCGFKERCRNEVREFYCPHGTTALLAINTGDKWARLTLTYGLPSLGAWSGDGGPYRVCGATSTPRFDRFGGPSVLVSDSHHNRYGASLRARSPAPSVSRVPCQVSGPATRR